jgi:hypothetical protein
LIPIANKLQAHVPARVLCRFNGQFKGGTFMNRAASLVAIAFALLLAGVPATAEDLQDRGTKEEQQACTPDVFRLCSAFIPDEKRILACLKQKKDKLSPACRRVLS